MEATVVSLAKSVLDGVFSKAMSAIADEVSLQLGVHRDLAFIMDEFEMMQTFLMAADEERSQHKVVMTWVKQVRDLAYDVEDCLQEFTVHLEKPAWWHFRSTLQARHQIAQKIKELRARVEDVCQRNLRYRLIKDSGSKPAATADEQATIGDAAIFGIDEARRAAEQYKLHKVDLVELITKGGQDLKVMSVWGMGGDLGKMSIIWNAYNDPTVREKFVCRAWVRLIHPCGPKDFIQSLICQFYGNSLEAIGKAPEGTCVGADVVKKMEKIENGCLIDEFEGYVNVKSFLIVIDGLSSIVEWEWIRTYFPNKMNGSRVIVSTQHVEIASLCTGQPNQVSQLKRFSHNQAIYVLFKEDFQRTEPPQVNMKPESSTSGNGSTVLTNEDIHEARVFGTGDSCSTSLHLNKDPSVTCSRSRAVTALDETELIGREADKSHVIKLISQDSKQRQVISVSGMGGLGKTTLVRSVYESKQLSGMFEKRAWVTVLHPFSHDEFLRSLALQLHEDPPGENGETDLSILEGVTKENFAMMSTAQLMQESVMFLQGKKYLIVLDDLSSIEEWDMMIVYFIEQRNGSRIVVTTRERSVAKYCSQEDKNIHMLGSLNEHAALNLLKRKSSRTRTSPRSKQHQTTKLLIQRL